MVQTINRLLFVRQLVLAYPQCPVLQRAMLHIVFGLFEIQCGEARDLADRLEWVPRARSPEDEPREWPHSDDGENAEPPAHPSSFRQGRKPCGHVVPRDTLDISQE